MLRRHPTFPPSYILVQKIVTLTLIRTIGHFPVILLSFYLLALSFWSGTDTAMRGMKLDILLCCTRVGTCGPDTDISHKNSKAKISAKIAYRTMCLIKISKFPRHPYSTVLIVLTYQFHLLRMFWPITAGLDAMITSRRNPTVGG